MRTGHGEKSGLVPVQIIRAPSLAIADRLYRRALDLRLTIFGASHEVMQLVGVWANNQVRVGTVVGEALAGPAPKSAIPRLQSLEALFLLLVRALVLLGLTSFNLG